MECVLNVFYLYVKGNDETGKFSTWLWMFWLENYIWVGFLACHHFLCGFQGQWLGRKKAAVPTAGVCQGRCMHRQAGVQETQLRLIRKGHWVHHPGDRRYSFFWAAEKAENSQVPSKGDLLCDSRRMFSWNVRMRLVVHSLQVRPWIQVFMRSLPEKFLLKYLYFINIYL